MTDHQDRLVPRKCKLVERLAAAAANFIFSTTAIAFPISYTLAGTATGVIGTTSFANAPFSVEVSGDTNAKAYRSFGWINPVIGAITIGGVGVSSITEPVVMRTMCSVVPTIGLERGTGADIFPHFLISANVIPVEACALGESAPIGSLDSTIGPEMNLATTRGALSLTMLGPITYQAQAVPTQVVYKAVAPCRIMDTRNASVQSGVHGPVVGNVLYRLPGFLEAGQTWGEYGGVSTSDCGLANPPGNAIHALALVITILDPNYDSYLGAGDVGDLTTTLSTVALNFTHGQGLSTMYVVPQLTNNAVYFAMPSGLSAHIVLDLIGYFVVADATALECTTQITGPVPNGLGVLGVITSACRTGYTLVSGSCDSTTTNFRLSRHEAYYANTAWNCYGFNVGPGPVALTATANCCRVPGR